VDCAKSHRNATISQWHQRYKNIPSSCWVLYKVYQRFL
jgi:hypothetical protein